MSNQTENNQGAEPNDTPERLNLLDFPCEFPIKVMGKRVDGFAQTIGELMQKLAPDFDVSTMEMRPSSSGKYLGLTCTVMATSQEQLDDIYRALTSHPLVSVAL